QRVVVHHEAGTLAIGRVDRVLQVVQLVGGDRRGASRGDAGGGGGDDPLGLGRAGARGEVVGLNTADAFAQGGAQDLDQVEGRIFHQFGRDQHEVGAELEGVER